MMKKLAILASLIVGFSLTVSAQQAQILKPPKGAQLAIVVFEDLQCPQCRRMAPLVEQAAKTYKIPLVRYDFPLPVHNWSFDAAVMARSFDVHSKQLGNEFRDYIFEHQMEITPENLRGFAEKFADDHKTVLPFVVDPKGEFAAKVTADRELGRRVGIQHTPTIYIVSNSRSAGHPPFIEVQDPKNQLFQTIDAMKKN